MADRVELRRANPRKRPEARDTGPAAPHRLAIAQALILTGPRTNNSGAVLPSRDTPAKPETKAAAVVGDLLALRGKVPTV